MKKALSAATLFLLFTVTAFFCTGCLQPDSVSGEDIEDFNLNGNIRITPNSATTGTELTAIYDGTEDITYQWKKDSTDVGGNSSKFTPNEEGSYTVTVSCNGYIPKTSSPVTVVVGGEGLPLSGTISIYPASAVSGTQLTAAYTGEETVSYQWKRDGINIGANSRLFTADTPGTYTVTVSAFGYNSKTSNTAGIYRLNEAIPIITRSYSADPSARVFDGPGGERRLYLYPSRDISPGTGNYSRMDRYRVYSTDNMADWIDHGEILKRDDLPVSAAAGNAANGAWGSHYTDAMFMWGPDAAYNPAGGGTYFFYFPHALGGIGTNPSWENSWTIGAAWSNSPCGGFNSNVVRLKDSAGNYVYGNRSLSSPCVFQDGDDYYLMTGGIGEFRIAKLRPNMIELAEPLTLMQVQHFKEGPWMFKREGKYYLMYSGNPSGGGNGDELLYATGGSPKGPWEYRGIILDPSGTGDTSQGSIMEFNGKWYLFYHNARLSKGNGALRSVCVAEISFDPDGTIRRVIPTATGVEQNGPDLDTNALNAAFGAGNYTVQGKYDENQSHLEVDFILLKTSYAMDSTVILAPRPGNLPPAAQWVTKGTHDIPLPSGAIHNLHIDGTYVDFTQMPGGKGGRALLRLRYALGDGTASLLVAVNGVPVNPQLSLPSTGGWGAVAESASVTINLNSGNSNTIRLSGAGVNIASMSIYMEME